MSAVFLWWRATAVMLSSFAVFYAANLINCSAVATVAVAVALTAAVAATVSGMVACLNEDEEEEEED